MKKITILIIIFSLILSCYNDNGKRVFNFEISDDIINVGIDAGFPPFGYLENGNIAGFDYDIMREIARLSGMKVDFTYIPFAGLLPALQTKKSMLL